MLQTHCILLTVNYNQVYTEGDNLTSHLTLGRVSGWPKMLQRLALKWSNPLATLLLVIVINSLML